MKAIKESYTSMGLWGKDESLLKDLDEVHIKVKEETLGEHALSPVERKRAHIAELRNKSKRRK